jgi:hypothetical protein
MPLARRFLLLVLLLALAPAAAAQGNPLGLLAAMKSATAKLKTLHAVVKVDERAGDSLDTRFVESWIDVKGGRVRTELRRLGCGSPDLIVVAGPTGMRFHQLAFDEIAEQKLALDLPTAVVASLAGELLATAFRGDLATLKVSGYGKPTLAPNGEKVAGVGCTKLVFPGNGSVDLWIADTDQLPRRLRGPLAGREIDETILELERDVALGSVDFEIPVAEGRKLPEPASVRERWRSPPPEEQRWPKPEEDAPEFGAVDLDAHPHRLSETAEHEAVIAFWTAEEERSPASAAELEKAWLAAAAESRPILLHVAAGGAREPVALAAAKAGVTQPVWIAGSFRDDAFRRWRIWSCPLFVRVHDMQVKELTRDVEVAKRWLK